MKLSHKSLFLAGLLLLIGSLQAQINLGGSPVSFTDQSIPGAFQEVQVQSPELIKLLQEDEKRNSLFEPPRFAQLVPVNFQPANSGTWTKMKDGRGIWRLGIHLEGSLAMSLYFTDFYLPEGAELFIYSSDKDQLLGAFSSFNNRPGGLFATELILSDDVVVELNVDMDKKPLAQFTISEISFAYRDVYNDRNSRGFGGSDPCEVNVNCSPEGDNWQDEKKGVARIQVKVGGALVWCSGSLIDNVRHDHIPYLLTADHCAYRFGNYATPEELALWVFYFNYEAESCDNPGVEPVHQSLTGAQWVANDGTHGSSGSDFYLLQLLDDIPYSIPVFFNGWSANDVASSSGVTIHHPEGDIKKLSTYTSAITTTSWQSNGLPSHWKVFWTETQNNWGVTEGGSSGSPLFDEQGHLIGTLTGGLASCTNKEDPDYYGKFSYHWVSNGNVSTHQLKPWLDPDNTGVMELTGSISGIVRNDDLSNNPVLLFPNPVSEILSIQFADHSLLPNRVEIFNVFGEIVYSKNAANIQPLEVDVSGWKADVYFVKISSKEQRIVKKMIKR